MKKHLVKMYRSSRKHRKLRNFHGILLRRKYFHGIYFRNFDLNIFPFFTFKFDQCEVHSKHDAMAK